MARVWVAGMEVRRGGECMRADGSLQAVACGNTATPERAWLPKCAGLTLRHHDADERYGGYVERVGAGAMQPAPSWHNLHGRRPDTVRVSMLCALVRDARLGGQGRTAQHDMCHFGSGRVLGTPCSTAAHLTMFVLSTHRSWTRLWA